MDGIQQYQDAINTLTNVVEQKGLPDAPTILAAQEEAAVKVFQNVLKTASQADQDLLYAALAQEVRIIAQRYLSE